MAFFELALRYLPLVSALLVPAGFGGGSLVIEPAARSPAPELPRAYVDTEYRAPTGNTIRVAAGGDLQAALNAAQPGDLILLEAGATYTGNFRLPNKGGSEYIVLSTDTDLPVAGTRVDPSMATSFARIVSPNNQGAIETDDGASYYRIMGVEITVASDEDDNSQVVDLGNGSETDVSRLAHHIILDRVYVHGHSNLHTKRCVEMNAGHSAVIDSYLSECHYKGFDSQAIVAWNTPGPLKIVNNYLEGAGENVMFGGADPGSADLVPADIEFRRNLVKKPADWFTSGKWSVKNLFEIKTGTRVLVEGNVFDGSWLDAQTGYAFNIKSVNQGGGFGEWSFVSDVTIRNNIIRNADNGINLGANPRGPVAMVLTRVLIENNLFEYMGKESPYFDGANRPRAFAFMQDVRYVVVRNNTMLGLFTNQAVFEGGGKEGFVFENNVVDEATYGWQNASSLFELAPGAVVSNNVFWPARWNEGLPSANCVTEQLDPVPFACSGAGVNFSELEAAVTGSE